VAEEESIDKLSNYHQYRIDYRGVGNLIDENGNWIEGKLQGLPRKLISEVQNIYPSSLQTKLVGKLSFQV